MYPITSYFEQRIQFVFPAFLENLNWCIVSSEIWPDDVARSANTGPPSSSTNRRGGRCQFACFHLDRNYEQRRFDRYFNANFSERGNWTWCFLRGFFLLLSLIKYMNSHSWREIFPTTNFHNSFREASAVCPFFRGKRWAWIHCILCCPPRYPRSSPSWFRFPPFPPWSSKPPATWPRRKWPEPD